MKNLAEITRKLQTPFYADEIEWRLQQSGLYGDKVWSIAIPYVQSRPIMDRLDEIFNPLGWRVSYREWKEDKQICCIEVFDEDKNQWIAKEDGAEDTKIESTKGGLSASFKRAAVAWGIGRYLYRMNTEYVECQFEKPANAVEWEKGKVKNNDGKWITFWWKIPSLPAWALPLDEEVTERMYLEILDIGKKKGYTPDKIDEACRKKYDKPIVDVTVKEYMEISNIINKR